MCFFFCSIISATGRIVNRIMILKSVCIWETKTVKDGGTTFSAITIKIDLSANLKEVNHFIIVLSLCVRFKG